MKTLASTIANLRCPACETVRGLLAAHWTFKGGVRRSKVNPFLECKTCRAKLRMVCQSQLRLMAFQLGLPLVFLFVFVWVVGWVMTNSALNAQLAATVVTLLVLGNLIMMAASALVARSIFRLEKI